MTRQTGILLLIAVVIFFPTGCTDEQKSSSETSVVEKSVVEKSAPVVYTCPMHPSVVSDKPGACPICGMTLVKRVEAPTTTTAGSTGAIMLSPEQRVTANVRTMRVTPGTHTGELITTGRVTFDERRVAQVTAYTGGRIERLFVNFTGDTVRRGQTVGTLYSPELFATQQEYLLSLQNRERMRRAGFTAARNASDDLVESTRRRLMLSGMTAPQIAQLERTGKPIFATNVLSPVSGVVTKKLAVEQQYVAQGQPLMEVADLTNVWVEADVYEQQLPDVKLGQTAEITSSASPGQTLTGKVSFIVPVLAGATRTARVRVELPNPRLLLKPDMYVNVRIVGTPAPPHLMVPASAIVDRGQKQFAWVQTAPGQFEPREVRTGQRHGAAIVVVSGLKDGDEVVVEGGFLLDSEAQLRSATTGGHEH